jgi:hypothetical protein
MIDCSDFGHELDSLVTLIREARTKLNAEKADIVNQIKSGSINRQEGILVLVEMNISHSNDIMLPVAQATLRAAQLQYSSSVLLTKSVSLARRLERLTCVLIVLTAILAIGPAVDSITAVKTLLQVTPPPIIKFPPPPPPLLFERWPRRGPIGRSEVGPPNHRSESISQHPQ